MSSRLISLGVVWRHWNCDEEHMLLVDLDALEFVVRLSGPDGEETLGVQEYLKRHPESRQEIREAIVAMAR